MGQTCAQFGHLVHLVNTLAGKEVQTIEIFLVSGEEQFVVRLLYADDGLVDGAFTLLNPLSHRVQVGGEIARSGEYTLVVLAFALAEELFPPFADEMELGLVVHHDFNLLASLRVETVAHGSIDGCGVLLVRSVLATHLFHFCCTCHQLADVESCTSDGQQTHGSEHRETSTHIVGDYECLVALFVGSGTGSTFLGVGHGHNHFLGLFFAALLLTLLLEQTEGEGCFGSGARLGNVDDTKLLVFKILSELVEVILSDIVAGKQDGRILLVIHQPSERVAQRLDDGTCTEVATSDACHHYSLAVVAEHISAILYLLQESRSDRRGQMQPPQEIVTRTCTIFKCLLGSFHFCLIAFYSSLL